MAGIKIWPRSNAVSVRPIAAFGKRLLRGGCDTAAAHSPKLLLLYMLGTRSIDPKLATPGERTQADLDVQTLESEDHADGYESMVILRAHRSHDQRYQCTGSMVQRKKPIDATHVEITGVSYCKLTHCASSYSNLPQ